MMNETPPLYESELDDTYQELLDGILHGYQHAFETCKLVSEALSYKRAIPKSFWLDENKGLYGILDLYQVPKSEIYKLRETLIKLIANRISNQTQTEYGDEIITDHYARYFHALSILKVPKNTELVPAITQNLKYNIAYSLWVLDDGSDEVWRAIDAATWYTTEALKNAETENRVLTGMRHNCK